MAYFVNKSFEPEMKVKTFSTEIFKFILLSFYLSNLGTAVGLEVNLTAFGDNEKHKTCYSLIRYLSCHSQWP